MSAAAGRSGPLRAGGPRGTTIAPTRGTAVDVQDHGVFESSDEEEATVRPSSGRGGNHGRTAASAAHSVSGRSAHGHRAINRPQLGHSGMARSNHRQPQTVRHDSMRNPARPYEDYYDEDGYDEDGYGYDEDSYGYDEDGYGYDEDGYDEVDYYEDEYDDGDGTFYEGDGGGAGQDADAVRAKSQWYDARHPPARKPHGYRDENLIYQMEGDDYEVYQYVVPSERADGGLALLQEIDRRANHLRDPHFSSLELWMRAQEGGLLRKIIDDDDDGYSYWTIENHNYDVAWACAEQGWWILGTGVGKDKGNFFMEQKQGR